MAQLTIGLPTRNRQSYCIEALKALSLNDADDFDVVVADNSDEPGILAGFFAEHMIDSRFRLMAPGETVLSMMDNWERLVAEATGDWISIIGDDDYIDPRVTGLIRRFERLVPEVEAISWGRMNFHWPDNRPVPTLASLPMGASAFIPERADLEDRLFRWSEGERRPTGGYGIYHGAVKRTLMERIKSNYGGRFFEHPTVDFDSNCKVLVEARALVGCERPFSVLGECAASNSAGTMSLERMQSRSETFFKESNSDLIGHLHEFPFPQFDNGGALCIAIAATTAWFCRRYGIDMTGFEANFAKAAMDECRYSRDRESYEARVTALRAGFAAWDGGKWADRFQPQPFRQPKSVNLLSGVTDETLYIRETRLRAKTPAEFYRFAEHAIMPVKHVIAGTRAFAT